MSKIKNMQRTRTTALLLATGAILAMFGIYFSGKQMSDAEIVSFIFTTIIFFLWAYIAHLKTKLLEKKD